MWEFNALVRNLEEQQKKQQRTNRSGGTRAGMTPILD